ncbi:serine hydrolase [candidate division KSB1 bacterium]|nr:serine hydrolase [candidate division KSB1 bacterium]
MTRRLILYSLVVDLLLFQLIGAQEKSPPSVPLQTKAKPEALIVHLQQRIPQLMQDGDVPGLSIALIRDEKLAWHQGFGVKNAETKEPVTDGTVFEAASLSKPVFAYAVLKLVDSGKLDLDKPLNQYLPGNYDVGDDPRLSQITARRVLTHTTGFPNWRPNGSPVLKIFFTPGEKFSYSGEGFVYLAKAVEHLTGESFDLFMKRLVFNPLGMNSSSYVWQEKFERVKAYKHNFIGKPAGLNKVTEANAAASLNTTASDYGKFVAAILKGTGLKKETAKLMLTPQVQVDEGGTNTTNRPVGKLSPYISWGLGWGLQKTDEGISFWHWGDNGNSKAYVVAFEKQKLGVAIFTNGANGLSIIPEIVNNAVGGNHPALDWLHYEPYNSPAKTLLKNIIAQGAEEALREYRQARNGNAVLNENQMNRLGYDLLYGARRVQDAIAVFKLNVEDYPESFNVYDSLGEAYMVNDDKELAIKNYQRSLELNPDNTNGVEMLKKLQAK